MSTERSLEDVWADQVAMAEARSLAIPTKCSPQLAADLREIGVEVDPEDVETDVAPVAHPGADDADFAFESAASLVVQERARFGLPTRPVGSPNRVRFVALESGEGWLVVPEAGGGR